MTIKLSAESSYKYKKNFMQDEEKKMEKKLEVNIAFKIWNQLNQLESILWDRYRNEFLNLNIEQDDKHPSQDDNQDVDDLL